MKGKFKTEFAEPAKFKKDLSKCYVSEFFVEELRNFYTEKERTGFLKKQNPNKQIKSCLDKESSTCHQTLYDYTILSERQKYYIFQSKGILSNIKFYHFHLNDLRPHKVKDRSKHINICKDFSETIKRRDRISDDSPFTPEINHKFREEVNNEDILIERQNHRCCFKQAPEEKDRKLELARHAYLSDYRLIHSGIIEVALSRLQNSRKREIESFTSIADFSPAGAKQQETEDIDLDYMFDTADDQDDPINGEQNHNRNSSSTKRKSHTTEQLEDRLKLQSRLSDWNPNEIDEASDDVSSEQEAKADAPDKKQNHIKRIDSGKGLFGITEWDSDEDELPVKKAFSFIGTNLDKFNVLNYLEDQEHMVAHN